MSRFANGRTLRGEVRVEGGGAGCPSDLAARLCLVPLAPAILEKLQKALPAGCRVIAVEIPAGSAVAATRFEAAGETGDFASCETGSECSTGACGFPVAPITRKGADASTLFAIFQSTAAGPRRAAMVVELAPAP